MQSNSSKPITPKSTIIRLIFGILLIVASVYLFCQFSWSDSAQGFFFITGGFGLIYSIIPALLLFIGISVGLKLIIDGIAGIIQIHHKPTISPQPRNKTPE